MSPSLYGFVKGREPVGPEEIAAGFLDLPNANGDALACVQRLVEGDPRFLWDGELLKTVDPATLALEEASYVVFDLETTGSSATKGGAITEIGALKLVRGEVVEEFSALVNPGRRIEPFVVRLTGITDRMVADAPPISEVMTRFEEFVEGSVLVGHNVQFDCSFVAAARGGVHLPNPVLDTLKLARCLVPGLKRYRLASLASDFGVRQIPNHRALSDAAATAGVFLKLSKLLRAAGIVGVSEAAALKGGRSGGGRGRPQKGHLADGVPDVPGVYYFVDKGGTVLYVGKAKNLKARVRTYFNGGDGRRKVGRLVEEVAEVRVTQTGSELRALILEAKEIKRLLPRYNSAGRDDRASWFIKLDTREPYPVPERVSSNAPEDGVIHLGPYRSAGTLDSCIEALGRVFPIRRCDGDPGDGVCFYGQMGRCAPCAGMDEEEYRLRVVDGVVALLRGEGGEEHLAALIEERKRLAASLEFEAAARVRDLVAGIERVRLARSVVSAEGVQAVVADSTEPGMVEVFVLSGGRLLSHQGFESGDSAGLSAFAGEALAAETSRPRGNGGAATAPGPASDEARVVAAYVRRRSGTVEAVRLRETRDLLGAVERVAGGSVGGETPPAW